MKKIIAVTGCPTGIAHTFMAAEKIERTAKEAGYEIKVETRGQAGVENELNQEDMNEAIGVIIAADVDVDIERFAGLRVLKVPVKDGIKRPLELLEQIASGDVPLMQGNSSKSSDGIRTKDTKGQFIYKSLMSGVSAMLPFTIVGGLFIALRFVFGTEADIAAGVTPIIENLQLGNFFMELGGILFGLMIPVLAAYIAFSIGKKQALLFGFIAGMVAVATGSGFIGAIIGGFAAGFISLGLLKLVTKMPESLQGASTILFMPFLGSIAIGVFMYLVGGPMSFINTGFSDFLIVVQGFNPVVFGAIIGVMMASDLGGPINKAAYVTATLLLAENGASIENQQFMAAVMAGGMVPPIAIAISALISKNKYTKEERELAPSNFILGLSFISEGAIPYAAGDPLRVIPSLMIGSAVASALTMYFGITLPAPHGGIFVFPLVNEPLMYLLAIAIGSIVGAVALTLLKKENK